jgi:hypothetical protein
MEVIMKNLFVLIVVICSFLLNTFSQEESYWNNAPAKGIKIYQVVFFNDQEGIAISKSGLILKTSDSGLNWYLENESEMIRQPDHFLWSAEIYCSAMNTKDGGITWEPFLGNQQDHFCNVYFNDKNTGWRVAEEFLSRVVNVINKYVQNDKVKMIIDKPNKCTEYYTDINEGWALGWCVKNFEKH